MRAVARLTPEVIETLVRITKGAVDPDDLDRQGALTILAMCADQRTAAYVAASWLNERGETFEQIAEAVKAEFGVEVHRATVARWAQPPGPDRRRRRGQGGAGE
jgi:hypothetical protein